MKKGIDYILLFFTALYLMVHFIPDLGGADVMGAQWLYTSLVDLSILGYLIWNRKVYGEAISAVLTNRFSLMYIFYVLWAFGSIAYAMNANEAIVCLARLTSTYLI